MSATSRTHGSGMSGVEVNPFGTPIDRPWLDDLENSTNFWNHNAQLQKIAYLAMEKDVSPWGLLMGVQLHRLSHIKPTVVLVQRDGTPDTLGGLFGGTSLNMFGGLTADSGGGKSVTFKLASSIMPPVHTPIADGTGQGLIKSIAETEKVSMEDGQKLAEPYYITRFNRHSLVVHAPEIKTLNAEFAREASKTDSMMRSMWSGETVGMTTGDRDRRVTLPANMYRIVGMWGVQPVNATAILAGADDGTPQRWLWAPGEEFRDGIVRINPGHVDFPFPVFGQVGSNPFGVSGGELPTEFRDGDALPSPTWVHWSPKMMTEVKAMQAARKALRNRDPYADLTEAQKDAEKAVTMQSHLTLTRIKLACLLGFLWGHANPTDDDWDLAGVQLQVSMRELAGIWKVANEARRDEIIVKGRERGLEMHAAQGARDTLGDATVEAFSREIWRMLCVEGPMTNRDIRKWAGGNARQKMVSWAIQVLEDDNLCAKDRNNMYWGLWDGKPAPAEKAHTYVP